MIDDESVERWLALDWPPPKHAELAAIASLTWGGLIYGLFLLPTGALALGRGPKGEGRIYALCQRIITLGNGAVGLRVKIGPDGVLQVFMNRKQIYADNLQLLPPYQLELRGVAKEVEGRIIPESCHRAKPAGRTEAHFVKALIDLEECISSHDWYDALKASALLRLLILDSPTLLSRVARTSRFKPQFVVVSGDFDEVAKIKAVQAIVLFVEPADARPESVLTLNLDQFLRHNVMLFEGTRLSVRDVIKAMANGMGGVHFDKANPGNEQSVQDLDAVVSPLDRSRSTTACIAMIGRCVLRALLPLALNILETGGPSVDRPQ